MRFLSGSFLVFRTCFSAFFPLSLRFGGVVGNKLLSLLMDLSVVFARTFFIGNSSSFASRKFFGEFCLSRLCFFFRRSARFSPPVWQKISGANFGPNFRERTFGILVAPSFRLQLLASTVLATIASTLVQCRCAGRSEGFWGLVWSVWSCLSCLALAVCALRQRL